MIKKIMISAGALAGLLVLAPYGTGILAEKELKRVTSRLDDLLPTVKFSWPDYQRGWFSTLFQFDVHEEKPERHFLQLKEHFEHGPVILSKHGFDLALASWHNNYTVQDLNLNQPRLDWFKKSLQKDTLNPVLSSRVRISFTGKWDQHFELTPLHLLFADRHADRRADRHSVDLMMYGWKGHFVTNYAFDRMDVSLKSKGIFADLKLDDPDRNFSQTVVFEQGPSQVRAELRQSQNQSIWVGQAEIDLGKTTLKIGKSTQAALNGFHLTKTSGIQDHSLHVKTQASFKSWKLDDRSYDQGRWVLEINDLDLPALVDLANTMTADERNLSNPLGMISLLPKLSKLADQGLSLKHAVDFKSPEGPVSWSVTFNLDKATTETNETKGNPLMNGAKDYLKRSHLDAHLKMPRDFLVLLLKLKDKSASPEQGQLKAWLKDGVLLEKGGDYVADFKFENNRWVLNGKPLP